MISVTEGLAAVLGVALREAHDTARFAAASDFQLPKNCDAQAQRACAMGVELAATAVARSLGFLPGSDARKAFMVACGANKES
jgi:hypothetical protein